MKQAIAIEWKRNQPKGRVEILNGLLGPLSIARGRGKTTAANFAFITQGSSRLVLRIADGRNHPGSDATIITVRVADSTIIPLASILSPGGGRKRNGTSTATRESRKA